MIQISLCLCYVKNLKIRQIVELKEVWGRYCAIGKENNVEIPSSFFSRMSTFKEKLVPHIRKFYEINVLLDLPANEKRTVFIPSEFFRSQWSNRKKKVKR